MAVFQGARVRTTALPTAGVVAGRRRAPAPASDHAAPRVRPMGVLMAAIVVTTMLGLVYLTQTLGSNATNSEIRGLEATRADLAKDLRRQVIVADDLIDGEVIIAAARKHKLKKLDVAIVLPAP